MTASDRSDSTLPERRAFLRVGFDCPVRWNTGGADRPGWARDASEAGAGFTTHAISAPEIGQTIQLIFELDPQLQWIADESAIVQRCEKQGDGLCNVGVRLSDPGLF